jgi:hypothetical protein
MFYRPRTGRFKDGYVFWNEGRFYLFGMYSHDADSEDYRNVWMAESEDGVHFSDVGPVIEAPFEVWAMSVYRIGDTFVLNHGSFTRPGVQNVIRFWDSKDLTHWTYRPERDLSPDTRWHHPDSRLDCMDVSHVTENGKSRYYGYATGPGGFLESGDGVNWSGGPEGAVEWDPLPAPPIPKDEGPFEVGGCQEIDGKYYLVGGWFNYMGHTGYGTYTLVGDSPVGPFRPDPVAYRLCGNSTRWVALWARFCRTPQELLVTNSYMYSGYSYESGETWLPPLKRAEVDRGGHLRLAYWQGNSAAKGSEVCIDPAGCLQVYPVADEPIPSANGSGSLCIEAGQERPSWLRVDVASKVVLLNNTFDLRQGIVLEGKVRATCRDARLASPAVGLYLEEKDSEGTAILLESHGMTRIGKLTIADGFIFDCEDVITSICASPAGIAPNVLHTFRLLVRGNMFELYLDDLLVQTFNTTHAPGTPGKVPRRIGFIVQNGQGHFEAIRAWEMNLA